MGYFELHHFSRFRCLQKVIILNVFCSLCIPLHHHGVLFIYHNLQLDKISGVDWVSCIFFKFLIQFWFLFANKIHSEHETIFYILLFFYIFFFNSNQFVVTAVILWLFSISPDTIKLFLFLCLKISLYFKQLIINNAK